MTMSVPFPDFITSARRELIPSEDFLVFFVGAISALSECRVFWIWWFLLDALRLCFGSNRGIGKFQANLSIRADSPNLPLAPRIT